MRKELMEKKNDLITRAEKIVETAKAEARELTAEEAGEVDKIYADVKDLETRAEAEDRAYELSKMKFKNEETEESDKRHERAESADKATEIRERQQFENYIRGKIIHQRAGELSPSTDPKSGGALIPKTIINYIIRKLYQISPILERSQKFNVNGDVYVPFYPADSNKITVSYIEEFEELVSSSGAFDTVKLTNFLAGCLTKISRSLINNVNFDIVGFVVDEMAYAIKRFCEHECLIGTPASGDDPAKVLGLSTLQNGVETSVAGVITADDLINCQDSVIDDFQENAIWIMSPKTRTAIRQLKAANGYYLLQDDITSPFGKVLLGKPVYVSDNMPEMVAGATPIYYGDMNGLATKFTEDMSVEVLRERFATQHAVGVVGYVDFDARVINEQMLSKITMPSA